MMKNIARTLQQITTVACLALFALNAQAASVKVKKLTINEGNSDHKITTELDKCTVVRSKTEKGDLVSFTAISLLDEGKIHVSMSGGGTTVVLNVAGSEESLSFQKERDARKAMERLLEHVTTCQQEK